jgi:hypothetical protein
MFNKLQSGYDRVTCNLTIFSERLQSGYKTIVCIVIEIKHLQCCVKIV